MELIRYMIRSKVSLLYLIDLDKAYDRVQREELWHCMKESGVAKENMRVVKKMYENSKTVVRCADQGSDTSPLFLVVVLDRVTDEVRHKGPQMTFNQIINNA